MKFARPQSLNEALALLQEDRYKVIAGGTDYYPALGDKLPDSSVLDITNIDDISGIGVTDAGIEIGALTSWADVIQADLPPSLHALQLAAAEVGSVQIQSRATIAGNLCNASPAADGVPALLCCDAVVRVKSTRGTRNLGISEFVQGNRRTGLAPDELLTSIFIPAASLSGCSDFLKLGSRRYLVISIAMVACRLVVENDRVTSASVAVGSCSEVATRVRSVEAALIGCNATTHSVGSVVPERIPELTPITDVRASADYRHKASAAIIKRSLAKCLAAGCEAFS